LHFSSSGVVALDHYSSPARLW